MKNQKLRLAILLFLLFFAIGFILWLQHNVDSNFVDTL
jgi:hypothetical protein